MPSRFHQITFVVLGAAAGCGGGNSGALADAPRGADAPAGDARADAVVDAGPGPVSVRVMLNGAPSAGNAVYFLNADSTVVSTTQTDANGSATATMLPGGSVTVIDPASNPNTQIYEVKTWLAVQPGDVLELRSSDASLSSTTLTVDIPPDTADSPDSYRILSACGEIDTDTAGSVSGSISNCAGTATFLVEAFVGENVIATLYAPDQDISSGTVALTGAYTAFGAEQVTVSDGTTAPYVTDVQLYSDDTQFQFGGEVITGSNGSDSIGIPAPATLAGATLATSVSESNSPRIDAQEYLTWGPPSASVAFDVAAVAMPQYTAAPQLDVDLRQVTWSSSGGVLTPDYDVVIFDATAPNNGGSVEWRITAPDNHAQTISLPTLPTDQFDAMLGSGAEIDVIGLDTIHATGGYDAFRPFEFATLPFFGGTGGFDVASLSGEPARVRRSVRLSPTELQLDAISATSPQNVFIVGDGVMLH